MEITNNTFIVTGGASGLGAATVRALHESGANVVIADMNSEQGEALAAELGDRVVFKTTDVASEEDAQATVDLAVSHFGSLCGLVNCAGIGGAAKTVGKHGAHPLDTFSKTIQVNLIGSFNMARLAATAMQDNEPTADNERGVIINTASIAAYDGQIGQAAYAASKGGVVSMTLPMARDLSRQGIRVMTIAPGLFLTPMLEALPEEVQAALGASVPYPPRLGKPAEYASTVKHIIGNVMMNGETIRLDGALRMAPK